MTELALAEKDITTIRRLAEQKARLAEDPVNVERRNAWYAHDSGGDSRPMILAEHGGVADEKKLRPSHEPGCEDDWARGIESAIVNEIFSFDVLKTDEVVESAWDVGWQVSSTGYGVEAEHHRSEQTSVMGAESWDAAIQDLDAEFHGLTPRTFSVDREATLAAKQRLEALFDGILEVRLRGMPWWSMGMTGVASQVVGLEGLMLEMLDNPEGIHRLMAFLRDDHLAAVEWYANEGLLTLNNENDYIGSGTRGYSRDLPDTSSHNGHDVEPGDLWVLLESQETVGISPEMFEEFVFPYQLSVAERFGRCYYGCCEPVHSRVHLIKQLPGIARISVAPWADQAVMADECGREIVFSRKPNPTLISTATVDEDAIRADLQHTLEVARGCRIELIMKDVHTLNNEPHRIVRWVELAREAVDATT
ncbi:MAG: hypothetical protein O2923_02740 [Verrucomicrobia bacterium]|nr:hypothetical protein [Verrucomicrobiota bacterium]MDA1086580.1 hypothetical protein [Verrucomicrobiota bacterium]